MRIVHRLDFIQLGSEQVSLTIGNFDGIHAGHQFILEKTVLTARIANGQSAVITFVNHPSEVLRPEQQVQLLITLQHKIRLFEQAGIDLLLLLPFTKALSELTADQFLKQIYQYLPFHSLILGYDATLGKDKKGDKAILQDIVDELGALLYYLEPVAIEEQVVSSSKIRALVKQGKLKEAEKLLGRPYSICAPVVSGQALGKQHGVPTVNMDVSQLCLPPYGVYFVKLHFQNRAYPGVANLGLSPTIKTTQKASLEVHLLDAEIDLYGKEVEVVFYQYLRPELHFSNIQELYLQIQQDIKAAKDFFHLS